MDRFRVLLLVICSLAILVAPGPAATARAQDAASHPLAGTWLVRSVTFPDEPPSIAVFEPGGGVIDTSADGSMSRGGWNATGENTADFTIWQLSDSGMTVLRGAVEVAADGQTFTVTFALELIDQDGTGSGQYGPGQAIGERLSVEGPGEPVGTLDDFLGLLTTPETGGFVEIVLVDLTEFTITSDRPTLTVGQEYVFVVTNLGALVHDFVIEPSGAIDQPLDNGVFEATFEDIDPGATAEMTWTFEEPGAYQLACHEPGHYEAGMVFQFEVAAP